MRIILVTVIFILFIFSIAAYVTYVPSYTGAPSDHFDGDIFYNRIPDKHKSFLDVASMLVSAPFKRESWPEQINDVTPLEASSLINNARKVVFINHSTVLIQVEGINIITDPIFSERCSPVSWAGPKRIRKPPISLEKLPHIDIVLISHNHYDHLDLPTLETLSNQEGGAPIYLVGLGVSHLLETIGIDTSVELDWGESYHYKDINVTFVEARHRSGRGLFDQLKTLWGGFVIEINDGSIFFAGDTGFGPHLKEIGNRYSPILVSLLPIGAYEPKWFMQEVHLNPQEAIMAHKALKSRLSIGIHFGTFQLTYEGIDDPKERIELIKADQKITNFKVPYFGELINF